MVKHGISRYEEFIQNYKNEENYIEENKINELYIIDDSGLNIDENMTFDILDDLKIIDIEVHLFDKIIVTIDCSESLCDISYLQFEFEDIMSCNGYKSNCKRSIDFVYLKEGFRLEFIEKKKNNKVKNTNSFEIEAKFLIIKKICRNEFIENELKKDKYRICDDRKKIAKKLHTMWNISYKQAYEAIQDVESGVKPYFVYDGLLKNYYDGFDKNYLDNLDISSDLKYFLQDLTLTETSIYKYGKTYKNDEIYLILTAFDGSKYVIIAIKFKGVISFNIEESYGCIDYWYEKIHYDKSYEISLGTHSNFINIHTKDIEIELIKDYVF